MDAHTRANRCAREAVLLAEHLDGCVRWAREAEAEIMAAPPNSRSKMKRPDWALRDSREAFQLRNTIREAAILTARAAEDAPEVAEAGAEHCSALLDRMRALDAMLTERFDELTPPEDRRHGGFGGHGRDKRTRRVREEGAERIRETEREIGDNGRGREYAANEPTLLEDAALEALAEELALTE